jgi:DNA mismatch repair protein MSH6
VPEAEDNIDTLQQAKKVVNYAESSDDEEPFTFASSKQRRRTTGRAVVKEEDEDDFDLGEDGAEDVEDGWYNLSGKPSTQLT